MHRSQAEPPSLVSGSAEFASGSGAATAPLSAAASPPPSDGPPRPLSTTEMSAAASPPPSDGPPRPLSTTEMSAWRGFLRAHARVIRLLEAELEAEQSLPLASYDVLVQ